MLSVFQALICLLSVTATFAEDLPEGASTTKFYLCQAHSETYLGEYKFRDFQDGASTFMNEEGVGLWRHASFWYMGPYNVWPPKTEWRCVVNCEEGRDEPPLTGFVPKSRADADLERPTLQLTPCDGFSEL
ncbi:hypothetical protein ScalyP_jg8172 [Parmales sp. scaly parma]|nr:hypothetical protein ScalyP_jg8172 [Parmales sp. scaly parma]